MHDVGHIMMALDIATGAWLIDFCLKATTSHDVRSCLRNFMADSKISEKYHRSFKEVVNDSFPG